MKKIKRVLELISFTIMAFIFNGRTVMADLMIDEPVFNMPDFDISRRAIESAKGSGLLVIGVIALLIAIVVLFTVSIIILLFKNKK